MNQFLIRSIGAVALAVCATLAPNLARASCVPPNTLMIILDEGQGIDEATFNAVIDRVEQHYAPVVHQAGGKLKFNRQWTNGTVNSDARRGWGGDWVVNSYGGLARYPGMTADAYMLIACHEMGHHLGGAPVFSGFFRNWASVEGEADYFATLKCMREILASDDNESLVNALSVTDLARNKCETQYAGSPRDQALCERVSVASQILGGVLAELGHDKAPDLATPDPTVVQQIYTNHPHAQCRLDTYMAGGICLAHGDLSSKDPLSGTCNDYGNDPGVRPLCWYKAD